MRSDDDEKEKKKKGFPFHSGKENDENINQESSEKISVERAIDAKECVVLYDGVGWGYYFS